MAAAQFSLCRKRALAALCLGLLHGEDEERRRKRNRKVYMQQWISRREERDVFHQLIRELEVGDVVAYKEFFGMTKEQFCIGEISGFPRVSGLQLQTRLLRPQRPPCFFFNLPRSRASMTANHKR